MSEKNERLEILSMVESGVISASEGARLLQALQDEEFPETTETGLDSEGGFSTAEGGAAAPSAQRNAVADHPREVFEPEIEKWRRWWMVPVWFGVGVTVIGALLAFWAYQASGFSFWFGCAWVPFFIGLGVIAMAWGSRTARWLHLRIKQKPGERPQTIAFSIPLPLRLTSWLLRTFGRFIPDLREHGVDVASVVQALERTTSSETPFYVEVDEGNGEEKVQIYIG